MDVSGKKPKVINDVSVLCIEYRILLSHKGYFTICFKTHRVKSRLVDEF